MKKSQIVEAINKINVACPTDDDEVIDLTRSSSGFIVGARDHAFQSTGNEMKNRTQSGDKDLIGAINRVSKDIDELVRKSREDLSDTEIALDTLVSSGSSDEQEMINSEIGTE